MNSKSCRTRYILNVIMKIFLNFRLFLLDFSSSSLIRIYIGSDGVWIVFEQYMLWKWDYHSNIKQQPKIESLNGSL